ncbi:3-hydroxybutyrate dehydrogenase [Pelagibacterium lentulum]|uniref:3-hydroxybutyrate dehydrogenase n=1 Tax=Pelagibacterium lentulum TaxID=2029865 RepID=A0A916R9U9_9HYPH|nr:3-hydroxybutyrate dehydrogenase [Pelagibacterium lentulum]GGA44117.1 3-hydroxybutyrate dehydrogenase [Pelagibacterium lentulum]
MSSDVEPKVVLVTGATSGIGLAIAKRFARAGHQLVINGLESVTDAQAAIAEIAGNGPCPPFYFEADLADGAESFALANAAIGKFGRVDVLVNNAGIQKVAAVEDLPPQDWERIIAVSLDSAYHTIRAALPGMKERGTGRIVNIASAHGLRASPYKSAYVATKHAVVGLTKTVALEVAEMGITVNAICPGYVWTPLVAAQVTDQAKVHGMSEEDVIRKVMLAPQPTKKFVQPEEVAELALYLASDMARSITGAAISIDGGWTAK